MHKELHYLLIYSVLRVKLLCQFLHLRQKVEATKGYGSEVILHGETFDDAKVKCEEIIRETGETYLHPYDDVEVMAGQGTID